MFHKKCTKTKRRRKRRANKVAPEPRPSLKLPDVVDPTVLLANSQPGDLLTTVISQPGDLLRSLLLRNQVIYLPLLLSNQVIYLPVVSYHCYLATR